ncbi:MAG: acyl-CoA/acyl-ACP dehydrogenase [Methylobacteriaceae bacterium]|nr:acyl-CoA/acyl-ACP dehydrogenase [Methylobacteriaceae bacterium]
MFTSIAEPEHRRQLRDSAADFLRRRCDAKAVRAAIETVDGFSRERWKAMADLGWTALLLPEKAGGLGLGFGDVAALHHEVGKAAAPEPLAVVSLLVAQAVARGCEGALREPVLNRLASGDVIATLAWQAAPGALGSDRVGPHAVRSGSSWRLAGRALFAPFAARADGLVVAARVASGVALFWLDGAPPVLEDRRLADGSTQASLSFDGVHLGTDALIAGPESGADILDGVLDTARLAASAELLGLAERAFAMTMEHLKTRRQFGAPIGSFQALQHRAVDHYIRIELARSALERAARVMDCGAAAAERGAEVSAAKARCGDTARDVARDCIQMHGAIGYTAECDLSLYVNRILVLSTWLGAARAHRDRWAALRLRSGEAA